MKEIILKKTMGILVVFTLLFIFLSQAHAGTLDLVIHQNSLNSVSDSAGSCQYEGGKFLLLLVLLMEYRQLPILLTMQ